VLKKEQILTDEIRELNRKGSLMYQENVELHKKVDILHQENTELQKKVYKLGGVNGANGSINIPYGLINGFELHAPTNLQLSQPQKNDTSEKAVKLGLQLH